MIPQSFIQELLNRLDIVDVVDRYVPLKKAGANYQACCPFHSEKTPSFTVSPTKQFYHCFGCGAHGTAISFLMEQQGMGFVEAVEELARSVGLTVPREETHGAPQPAKDKLDELSGVMERAARYYREQLKQSDAAIAYLKGRGLSGEIAARFGIGYAPAGWQGLAAVVPDYRSSQALLEAGLVIDNDEGKRYDRFRDPQPARHRDRLRWTGDGRG
jgi:DNA primase